MEEYAGRSTELPRTALRAAVPPAFMLPAAHPTRQHITIALGGTPHHTGTPKPSDHRARLVAAGFDRDRCHPAPAHRVLPGLAAGAPRRPCCWPFVPWSRQIPPSRRWGKHCCGRSHHSRALGSGRRCDWR